MSELLKSLWGKFYAWALPSALVLGAYWLLIHPQATISHGWIKASDGEKGVIFAGATATMAFCMNALSQQLYRILEGYLGWPAWLQARGVARQLERKKKLEADRAGTGWRRGLALEKLALYPLRDEQVVPTRFGNALRSFETYGKTRFNLDSQTLWNELCAVAPKYIETELDRARSSVDFFVASVYLSAAFGCLALVLGVYEHKAGIFLLFIPALLIAVLCHWTAVRVTRDWSLAVQALVNIGRLKLATEFGLQLPGNIEDERKMWGLVTSYVFFGNLERALELDRFRKKPESAPPPAEAAAAPAAEEEDG